MSAVRTDPSASHREVRVRLLADGTVLRSVDEDERTARQVIEELADEGVERPVTPDLTALDLAPIASARPPPLPSGCHLKDCL